MTKTEKTEKIMAALAETVITPRTPDIDDLASLLQDMERTGCVSVLEYDGWKYELQEGGAILATELP